MDGESHKLRMKGVENELASLILFESWKWKMPIKEYVQWQERKIVDDEYNMVELVDLAWVREFHLG